jgi:hypothetical protein
VQTGARIQVQFSVNRATLMLLRHRNQPVPQPIIVTAIIDTGAERTCIDPMVARNANLTVYGFGLSAAPGTTAKPLPQLGGATANAVYQSTLTIIHPQKHSDLVLPELTVGSLPLASFGIEAVIGRDVLASCVLVYNGTTGSATLAY